MLDGEQPAALAIVRSLGRRGVTVDAGERSAGFLSSYSKFISASFTYPDPLVAPAKFVEAIADRVECERYDLVIPVTEDTVQPLARERARIEGRTKLAIAPNDALEIMTNKAKTFDLAQKLGVPIPKSWTFAEEDALVRSAPDLPYPIVIKPSRSIADAAGGGSSGRNRTKLSVMYAHDPGELTRLARSVLPLGPIILQEYFRGTGVGVEILADRGQVVYAFQHKRLHQLPLTGGGSCLRESVPVHPGLLDYARRIVGATGWHGVAMVEFKLDEGSGDARLMEVNGRFWGSLPLAVAAGADFPYLLLDLLTENRRPDPSAPPARVGVVARKLSSDVYWYVQVLRPDQEEPLIEWPTKLGAAKDLLLCASPRHRFDVQALEDPRPGLVDLYRTGDWFLERFREVSRRRRIERAERKLRARGTLIHQRIPSAGSILFVCYGNINRSMLAEHHLKSLLARGTGVEIRSAGFHEEDRRPPDPSMVREAARHGLSYGEARSRRLDDPMIERADLILAMEVKHLVRLHDEFRASRGKAFLLSSVAGPADVGIEIADPYGGDETAFARCFREVTTCTRSIARAIDAGDRHTTVGGSGTGAPGARSA